MPQSRCGKPRTEQARQAVNGRANSEWQHEVQGQLVRLNADCADTQSLPLPDRPWSEWFPGDDGRWFYQGRLKADGSGWEYQFTQGYPPKIRRPDADNIYSPGASLPGGNCGISNGNPSAIVQQGHLEPTEVTAEGTVEDIGQADATTLEPTNSGLSLGQPESRLQLVTFRSVARRARASKTGTEASQIPGTSFREGFARKKKKKLDSIVKSEKELKFNPRRSVKTWLDGVEP